ncbi:BZ3500_MvSof-1268-A1-R1_Chr3-1g06046 [Microbotryum saponariae]|uniref:BZ3500_MvSof-1268-A1-R1_Chr3-1g06046 protein n=1 Tax=Microbotryum saponariae TaxID=289078 RepID=A0A2X0LDK9_9BASI|nr:BZ3500_MvSof-1268-A1-R1_Chr3-1g06046 [Microbotryum saponariae]SDA03859.1 BZ3501_MvSof-1269-A2-R1_Chr3-2g05731 [Microbotryum saponariae]
MDRWLHLPTCQTLLFQLPTRRSHGLAVDSALGANSGARDHRHRRHRWYHDYRLLFATLLVCSICALASYHFQAKAHMLSWLRQSTSSASGPRPPLTQTIVAGVLSPDSSSRQDFGDDNVINDLPGWADYDAISSSTFPLSNTIVPVIMHHFDVAHLEAPYDQVYIVSAFVDPRPLVVPNARREILMHAVLNGISWSNEGRYPDDVIECSVLIRQPDGTVIATTGRAKSSPAYHYRRGHMTLSQDQIVCSLARIPQMSYDAIAWERAEIYVTVNPIDVSPPPDAFILARSVAALDVDEHRTGRGQGAVCLAPLRGELYSSSIKDHISYQKSLGFTRIYIYLLDPGPITLSVLRKLASADPDIVLVRWGILKDWFITPEPLRRTFAVDPSQWNLPGIEPLEPAREALLGTARTSQSVALWYWGQNLAAQDCYFRSMADGVRWVASVDWDEYFVLQPAGKLTWDVPPRSADPIEAMAPFLEWTRDLRRPFDIKEAAGYMLHPYDENRIKVDVESITKGMLPSCMIFSQSLGKSTCKAQSSPPQTPVLEEIMDRFGTWDWLEPGATVPAAFSTPVRNQYTFWGDRSKKVVDPWLSAPMQRSVARPHQLTQKLDAIHRAYFLDSTHHVETGYATYAVRDGVCSKTSSVIVNKEMSRRDCVEIVLRAFGGQPMPVPVTKAVVTYRPGFAGPWSNITGSSGSLRHFRVAMPVVRGTLQVTKQLTDFSPMLLSSPESQKVRSNRSSGICKSFAEDWTVVQVMERSLERVFEDRTEGTVPSNQRPTPDAVVTTKQVPGPALPSLQALRSEPFAPSTGALLLAVVAILALVYVLVTRLRYHKRKRPEGYAMMKQEQA